MAISKDLFLSILSMDAYNRGCSAGLGDTGVGDLDGLGETGYVGNARILARPSGTDLAGWQDAGFYALAYEIAAEVGAGVDRLLAGDTVIACRGAAAAGAGAGAGRTGFVRPRSPTPSAPARLRPGAGRGNPGRADRCGSRPPAA